MTLVIIVCSYSLYRLLKYSAQRNLFQAFSDVGNFRKRTYYFEMDMSFTLCSVKSKILPQILSKWANFIPVICTIILSTKISFYGNNSGEIPKRIFFMRQPIRNLIRPGSI